MDKRYVESLVATRVFRMGRQRALVDELPRLADIGRSLTGALHAAATTAVLWSFAVYPIVTAIIHTTCNEPSEPNSEETLFRLADRIFLPPAADDRGGGSRRLGHFARQPRATRRLARNVSFVRAGQH